MKLHFNVNLVILLNLFHKLLSLFPMKLFKL